jgi:hypothetical protein
MEDNHQQNFSKQETDDIKLVSDDIFMEGAFSGLPLERRTAAVSQAALLASFENMKEVPKNILNDEFILGVLRRDGDFISVVDMERRTPEMYRTALENEALALRHFPHEMITPEIAMNAVKNNSGALAFVPQELKTPDMCRYALKHCSDTGYLDFDVISEVPFSDVCMEHLKEYENEKGDPFLAFGNMKPEVITPEMAQLAVRLEPSCIQFVPDQMKTKEMCAEAVEKDWMNMRFVPEKMKTKELCEAAMGRSIHAQQLIPERFKTPEMYMNAVKGWGLDLQHVPEKFRTPEICLQAVMSNPAAGDFVPERFPGNYNIYEFYHGKLHDDFLLAGRLNFEQVQKVFNGEPVHISGMKFANNVTLKDFTLDYDSKTHRIITKAVDDRLEKKPEHRNIRQPEKRRKMKI